MTNENYELRIISKDQKSNGKALKKYTIDGEEIVGAMENESFEIEFKNKTWAKIQVRLSVDGTDISTGELASTSSDGEMWFVEPYGTLRLKAWPESSKGGAEFLFGKVEDSVAANIHGNLSAKGIIAAAIFIEGHNPYQQVYLAGYQGAYGSLGSIGTLGVFNSSNTAIGSNSVSLNSARRSVKSKESNILRASSGVQDFTLEESSLAVGAGNYVAQEIVKVAGLTKPVLSTTIQVKYESWNSLRSKVLAIKKAVVNVSNPAFPGDAKLETKMIDLKGTPKGKNRSSRKPARSPDLQRF